MRTLHIRGIRSAEVTKPAEDLPQIQRYKSECHAYSMRHSPSRGPLLSPQKPQRRAHETQRILKRRPKTPKGPREGPKTPLGAKNIGGVLIFDNNYTWHLHFDNRYTVLGPEYQKL